MIKNRRLLLTIGMVAIGYLSVLAQQSGATGYKMQPISIQTRWAKEVSPSNALKEYPRPQMVRSHWQNLNGLWDYAIADSGRPKPTVMDGKILVPYPVESALSGVKRTLLPDQWLWYSKQITRPALKKGERLLLHFGAVDWQATVYLNNKLVGSHSGGYQNFSFDITDMLREGSNELLVKVYDPTDNNPSGTSDQSNTINPFGKQSLNPFGIFYTACSGIWQTVWLETVPAVSIASLYMTPDVDAGYLSLSVFTSGIATGYEVEAIAMEDSKPVGKIKATAGETIKIKIPNARLWSPDDPFLYDLRVRLVQKNTVVDEVKSYFGMRKIEKKKDADGYTRIFLNNKFIFNNGVLDQGFWPDGIYTAATDEALKFDVQAVKAMGFNSIRKHIKVEPARWYYHCDKLGILVWQDMPCRMSVTPASVAIWEKESKENLFQLHNYPSIIIWTVFNENWGAYDQSRVTQDFKKADPSRLINGHSGENLSAVRDEPNSDIVDVHQQIGAPLPPYENKVKFVGEYGAGFAGVAEHRWNDVTYYDDIHQGNYFVQVAIDMKEEMAKGLSGANIVQAFDVEDEQNGIITYDRAAIKMPLSEILKINESIIPRAKNYAAATAGFFIDSLGVDNLNNAYNYYLSLYKKGQHDSLCLRKLALYTFAVGDEKEAIKFSNEYLDKIKAPYTWDNLIFAGKFVTSSASKAFDIYKNDPEKVDRVAGNFALRNPFAGKLVMDVISREEIQPKIKEGMGVEDWNKIEAAVIKKYSGIGEETVLKEAVNYFMISNTVLFGNYFKRYASVYHPRSPADEETMAAISDMVFHKVDNVDVNKVAADWVLHYLLNKPERCFNINNIRLYGSLLYKSGDGSGQGYIQNALKLAAGNAGLSKTLKEMSDKMSKGEKIW